MKLNGQPFTRAEKDAEAQEEIKKQALDIVAVNDATDIAFVALAQNDMLDEAVITENPGKFILWSEEFTGKAGTIVQELTAEGRLVGLYKAIHDIGAGQNHRPRETPAMWTRIGNPEEEYPEWYQPIGAHDAYQKGAKVSHNQKRWVSNIYDNVWEPGVHGWGEIKEVVK